MKNSQHDNEFEYSVYAHHHNHFERVSEEE